MHGCAAQGMGASGIDALLNKQSGLQGLAGTSDLRSVLAAREAGEERAKIAYEVRTSAQLRSVSVQLVGSRSPLHRRQTQADCTLQRCPALLCGLQEQARGACVSVTPCRCSSTGCASTWAPTCCSWAGWTPSPGRPASGRTALQCAETLWRTCRCAAPVPSHQRVGAWGPCLRPAV